MAKIKLPSYIKEGRGRMEDAVLVTMPNGEMYMKPYKKHYSNTENQAEVRKAFATLVKDWKYLTGVISDSWELGTDGTNASGYNIFMGANISHRRNGEPLELCKGTGEELLMNFTAETGTSAGEIICSFLPPEAGCHVTIFARREVELGLISKFTRYDAGANPSSPYTITGLESGAQYYIYAVVTDAQYDTALTVSQSVAALATAG